MTRMSLSPTHFRFISKLTSLAAAVLALSTPMVGGCKGESGNQLIGSWKFASLTGTTTNCFASAVFKDDAIVLNYPERPPLPNNPYSTAVPGRTVNMVVDRYMPSPSLVVVMANGDHVNYKFTDKDHMFFETPWGNCYYQRAD